MRSWHGEMQLESKTYICGYCCVTVGPNKGIFSQDRKGAQSRIYFCSNCGQPTYFDEVGRQFPGAKFGNSVQYLPRDIEQIYGEARGAMSAQAYTPAVLACRKILMNVAVGLGAKPG